MKKLIVKTSIAYKDINQQEVIIKLMGLNPAYWIGSSAHSISPSCIVFLLFPLRCKRKNRKQ